MELPCPTGVERALVELLRALPAVLGDGDDVVVAAPGQVELELAPDGRARVRSVATGGPTTLAVWRETHLAPLLQQVGADVLWSPVAAVPLRTDVPRVATIHETPWLVRRHLEGRLRERVHQVRLRLAARVAARLVCPSESSADQVRALHPRAAERVRVVPHGVPRRFLVPRDDVATDRVLARHGLRRGGYHLHVGGSRARKNVPLLLRAHLDHRIRGGRADLVLVGPGEPPERPAPGVRHLGYVSDELLLHLYDGAAALVVSSESEGFGIPVLEAMARGLPVVAPDVGGLPEAAGGAALLVPPLDQPALADALLRLEQDAALRASLSNSGVARAAEARWESSAARLLDVLREAAASRDPTS